MHVWKMEFSDIKYSMSPGLWVYHITSAKFQQTLLMTNTVEWT